MSDGPALLAAICANPDEDTPRLAYADWLDEHAGAMPKDKRESVRMRAELIRVQCELHAMPPEEENAETATRRVELELRAEELLKNHSRRRAWAKPLREPFPDCPNLVANEYIFVRGFPLFTQNAKTESYLTAGEGFFDLWPVHALKCVGLTGDTADRFYAAPWLPRVRRLTFSTGGADETRAANAEGLVATAGLGNLEELTLSNWEFSAPGAPVAGRALANLRSFSLGTGKWSGPATYARLGELLPAGVRLRDFALGNERATADEVRAALALPQLQRAERLSFGVPRSFYSSAAALGVDGVAALVGSPCWRTLRALHDRDQRRFRAAEVEALAAAPPTPNLRTLTLASGELGVGLRIRDLAQSPLLAPVTSLDLSGTRFADAGAYALAKSPHLGRLVSLNLARTDVGPKGLKMLAEAAFAPNLVRLNVNGCPIRKGGIEALVSVAFPRLKHVEAIGAAKLGAQKQRLYERFGDGARV
jgi:uncharacterized protein (TIGR02996 family)